MVFTRWTMSSHNMLVYCYRVYCKPNTNSIFIKRALRGLSRKITAQRCCPSTHQQDHFRNQHLSRSFSTLSTGSPMYYVYCSSILAITNYEDDQLVPAIAVAPVTTIIHQQQPWLHIYHHCEAGLTMFKDDSQSPFEIIVKIWPIIVGQHQSL